MSDKFGEGRDPYLYPGLDIMRNRLNIRQQQRLEQAAYEMTALRAATIELGPLVRGLPHLRTIHRQLYQDIFDWAGQLREVDIYQGDTPFCHFAYIEKEGNALMQDRSSIKRWPTIPLPIIASLTLLIFASISFLLPPTLTIQQPRLLM